MTGLMSDAGLKDITAKAVELSLTPPNGARGAARGASRVGPAARIIKAFSGTEADAKAIEDDVTIVFEQFLHGKQAHVPAVINLFTCRI